MMTAVDQSVQVHPQPNRARWLRFALGFAVVSIILFGVIAYFARPPSPEMQRETLLEAMRLAVAEPPTKDLKRALSIALKLADMGYRDAQVLAGILFSFDKVEPKAIEQLRKAESAGSLYACRHLAIMGGRLEDLNRSAMCGDRLIQGILGWRRIRQEQPDLVSGVAFLEAGVANGDGFAHLELGRLHALGTHVPKDKERAAQLLRTALEKGQSEAGHVLVIMNMINRTNKIAIAAMDADDVDSCLKGADLGDKWCQSAVGMLYMLGEKLPRDDVLAHKWLNLAVANSDSDSSDYESDMRARAREARTLVERTMSSAQFAETQRLAREWKPKKVDEPQEPPLVRAIRELRDEMDGKFPAIPQLPSQSTSPIAPVPPAAAKSERKPDLSAVVAPAHKDVSPTIPNVAGTEPIEKKLTPSATPIDFISQSLCGKLVKDSAALSVRTGSIQGCKKLQRGGRSTMTVDNAANDTAVLVKLYPTGVPNAAPARVFTIRAKDSWTESEIRAGTYELRYEDLASNAFTKTESLTLNERHVEGGVEFSRLKVTLYKVKNGNMKTQPIAKSEFDD